MRNLCLMVLLSGIAQAQDAPLEEGAEVADDMSQQFEVDSKEARDNNRFVMGAEVFGFTPLPSFGLSAGYFVNPDLAYELQGTWGGFGRFEKSDYLQGNLIARWFFGETEFVNLGLGYQKFTKSGQDLLGNSSDSKKSISSFGVVFGVGSRWQWSQIFWGIDWLGVYIPIKVTDRTFREDAGNAFASGVERDLLSNEKAKLTLNLFRATIGFAP